MLNYPNCVIDYFCDTQNPHHEVLLQVLKRLQGDRDRDVRYFASYSHTIHDDVSISTNCHVICRVITELTKVSNKELPICVLVFRSLILCARGFVFNSEEAQKKVLTQEA